MVENNSENNLATDSGKKFFTAQARRAHVREYQMNGESMIVYCDQHHLALSTFKTWVTKYGEKKVPAQFVPMVIASRDTSSEISKTKSLLCCEIHAGAIKVILPEITDIETLIQLIRGLSHANPVKSTNNTVL